MDRLILQPISSSDIVINNITNYKYKFNIISNENITNNDNLELLFLNTQQSNNSIIISSFSINLLLLKGK